MIFRIVFLTFLPILGFSQTESYLLSKSESHLTWEGTNITGGGHVGTLKFSNGDVKTDGGSISKGVFVVDMNSIQSTDQKNKKNREELDDHLRGEDFFATKQFPKASFMITNMTLTSPGNYMVTGLLAIRSNVNLISFPALISTGNNKIHATAEIKIDRTKWNITYQSKTIFTQMKDAVIADEIKLKIDITFVKK